MPFVKGKLLRLTSKAFGVEEYHLPNGLRVLYKHVKGAPVVAVCVTFHVGSRNEAKGHTGSTHILEHLLFKDTRNFNKKKGNAVTDFLERLGASVNATTWLDRTNYFELLPSERLEEGLALEADRMRGSLFTDADLASEMTIVRNEYERTRNNPFELLEEKVTAAAFTVHPYRIPTIGTKEDIENSNAKKLREFYDRFYWPNNATLTVMGDVPFSKVSALIEEYFAPIPSSPKPIPKVTIVEPEQKESRFVEIKKSAGVSIVEISYKIPEATHPDFPALMATSVILAGGFSSRLVKKLVDTGLVADVSAIAWPLHDPSVFNVIAHCDPQTDTKKILKIIRDEVAKLGKQGPAKAEVTRAQNRILSMNAVERDGVFNEVRSVSEAIAAGDWKLTYTIPEKVKKLEPSDVARVTRNYLQTHRETVGILHHQNP